jgi:hypothetical protein
MFGRLVAMGEAAVILEASAITVALGLDAEYFRSRRGPLVLLALAVLHARAALLCLRWELSHVPQRWRVLYPLAVERTRKWT